MNAAQPLTPLLLVLDRFPTQPRGDALISRLWTPYSRRQTPQGRTRLRDTCIQRLRALRGGLGLVIWGENGLFLIMIIMSQGGVESVLAYLTAPCA